MFAQHRQNHRCLILAIAIGSGLVWSGIGTPRPAQAQDPAIQLYVSNITAGWVRGTGRQKKGVAIVDIVDGNGTPVNGALVIGDWSGCFRLNGASDSTETVCTTIGGEPMPCVDGRAVIWGKSHTCRTKNCLFAFTITSVQKPGMTYVPVEGMTSGGMWCDVFNSPTASRGTKATLQQPQHGYAHAADTEPQTGTLVAPLRQQKQFQNSLPTLGRVEEGRVSRWGLAGKASS